MDIKDIKNIKEIALENGFKLREQASGNMDLNSYVYIFAEKLLENKQAEIDELKAKLEQQPLWVSIDLLKPQYDTDVLVCFSDDDTPEIDRLISGENLDYFAKNGCDVAYWMPLPKLPHEAQEQAQ